MRNRQISRSVAAVVLAAAGLVGVINPPHANAVANPLVRDISMGNVATNERELSIAVDPSNANRLMAGSNQRGGGQAWFRSNDGGRTWANGALPFGTLTVPGTSSLTASDPSLAYGNDGTLYYSALAHDGGGLNIGSLFVTATTDQGANWTDLANGVVAAGAAVPTNVLQDKEHIAVDQANNNVYVAWTPIGGANHQEIVFARDLGGVGNGFAFNAPLVITTAAGFNSCLNQGADMTMVGARIYLTWTSFCSGFAHGDPAGVWVAFSDNQGTSFSAPVQVATLDNVDHTAQGFRSRSHPSIDASSGRVFVVWATNANAAANTDGDVMISSSTDGVTWSVPSTVNAEPSAADQDEQWMPWVTTGNGRVHVVYYCWDDEGTSINACMATAPIAASPAFTERVISSAPTPTSTGFLGDYNGNFVGSDDVVHPAWGDGRAAVGGATDAYTARVDFSPPTTVNLTGPATKPWGDNASFTATVLGAVGENEQFIPVKFTVTGGGSPSPTTATATTNAAGQAAFTFTNPIAATNTVHVWADLDENGTEQADEGKDLSITWTAHPTTTTYTGPASGTYSDPVTLSGTLLDSLLGTPISGETLTLSVGTDSCTGVTNGSGAASCSVPLTQVPGTGYAATASFAATVQYATSSGTAPFTILKETTVLTYSGPTLIANNLAITLKAALTEDDGPAVAGRTVDFTLGTGASAQICSGVTNATGVASCTIAMVNQPLGPGVVAANFAGDAYYLPSNASATTIVFQWTTGGNFVIGSGNAAINNTTTFWSSKWSTLNAPSSGAAPDSFKGFANSPAGPTTCGGTWTTSGGNSPPPPSGLPSYTAMLVTDSVTKAGPVITGTKPTIVVVQTNADYGPAPGKTGTAQVLAVLCP